MSKLDELIQKYCPDGVEYKELQAILKIKNGSDYKAFGAGEVPVYGSGGIMTYIDRHVYNKPSVLIPRKGSIDKLYYVDTPFWNVDTIFYTEINTDLAIPRYVYHCLLRECLEQYNNAGGVPSLTQKVLNKIQIPVPPLPVQSEIVRVLDNFTELTAELTARKKQYEFYRDKLLTFDGANAPLLELRSVVKNSCSGSSPTKGNSEYHTNGTIPWIRTQDVCYNEITEVDSYITEKAVAETAAKWIPENCVIVAISGPTAGRCAINKIKATTDQYCLNLEIDETKALEKYIYYCVHSKYDELISRRQGARGDLDSDLVLSLKIPVPALDVQKRLVYVLDHFDTICSDLKIGLPAEMEARQKQYEFYRDALLTYAATGKISLKDRPAKELNGLIQLCQYVFGFVSVELGTIGKVSMCKRIMKAETSTSGDVPFFKIGTFGKVPDAYIPRAKFEEYKAAYAYPSKGDILISAAGTIGRTVVFNGEDAYYQDSNIVWIANDESVVLNRYLYYYYQLQPWNVSTGGTIARLYNDNISKARIAVPPITEQNRIVSILDRFDTLCSDLTSGLPAEIEARKKQYEYYRDKLLTFQE